MKKRLKLHEILSMLNSPSKSGPITNFSQRLAFSSYMDEPLFEFKTKKGGT